MLHVRKAEGIKKTFLCLNPEECPFKDRKNQHHANVRCFSKWEIRKECRFWFYNFRKNHNGQF